MIQVSVGCRLCALLNWVDALESHVGLTAAGAVSGDPKNAHLSRLDGAAGSLRLFKADMLDPDALAAAVAGCEGVFHVASPVPSVKAVDPEARAYLN